MKKILQKIAGHCGYRIEKIRRPLPGPEIIVLDLVLQQLNEQRGGQITFVEIGANDGKNEDPLYPWIQRFPWRGILVEPQPKLCAGLTELWKGREGISIVQAAIGTTRGYATLWCVEEQPDAPDLSGIASLNRETILMHRSRIPDIESRLKAIQVPVMTFEDLLTANSIENLDVLQIDAEGFDFEIIKALDFKMIKPDVISYEHCNLSKDDQFACRDLLRSHDYGFASYLGDTVAVQMKFLPAEQDRSMCRL